ncbi:hypothetical protein NPIL_28061 [Nephila pilipes]|uniref:Uncharacterized protein n=1 Tax=Nephila pilipes TaxID=299642 RepID=A0A8X6QL06_NEPPI|nr:hypothetical protein NPIL_28061 [Nephila pilipes]
MMMQGETSTSGCHASKTKFRLIPNSTQRSETQAGKKSHVCYVRRRMLPDHNVSRPPISLHALQKVIAKDLQKECRFKNRFLRKSSNRIEKKSFVFQL